MKEKEILYDIIIYQDTKRLKIYNKKELIVDLFYNTDMEMYQSIVNNTRDCLNVEKINIIYK